MKTNAPIQRHSPSRDHRARRGFTLIELLLVLVILGILAGIILPNLSRRTGPARVTAATVQLSSFRTALNAFEVDNGYYPRGSKGLQDLVTPPREADNWKGPYLNEVPLDPWKHPYIYECPGKHNQFAYDITSMGPDGVLGSADDIVNWSQAKP